MVLASWFTIVLSCVIPLNHYYLCFNSHHNITDCTQSTNESSIGAEPELGDIRLSDGCSGELEVYSNPLNIEGWYSVCAANSGFLERESQVVCKQLGCPMDGATQTYRYYDIVHKHNNIKD